MSVNNRYPMFSEETSKKEQERIQVEKALNKAMQYWPVFVACAVVSLILGQVYLKYVTPLFKVNAKILIKDEKKGSSAEGQLFQDLGMNSGVASVDNEVEIMKSSMLMEAVVKELNLNIRYLDNSSFRAKELYESSPVRFKLIDEFATITNGHSYDVKINPSKQITISSGEKTWAGNLNDTFDLFDGKIAVVENGNKEQGINEVLVQVSNPQAVADNYRAALEIEPVNKQVSIINLGISDNIPERGEDILNTLIAVYIKAGIDDKNKISDGTLDFISERLAIIEGDLNGIERQIETFKKDNKIVAITDQSRLLLDNTGEYNKQLTEQEVQLNLLESLEQYLNNNRDRIVPSTFLLQDITLTKIIERYNLLQAQRQNLLITNTAQSPYVKNIERELQALREDMRNTLASSKTALNTTAKQLRKENGVIESKMQSIPEKERIYLEFSRKQEVLQELYLFLLKKREETAISKSSTIANTRILEPARKNGAPFFPSKSKVYLAALAIGIFLPASWILVKEVFSIRIKSIDDINSLTGMPVIGEIGHNKEKSVVVVTKNSRTVLSEQFRALRTNLHFLLTDKDDKVIMITSSMGGEGKSFVSINLSSTLSISGKKVVLMELDLRKPKVSHHLGISNKIGFSDYAIGKAGIDDIIVPSGVSENLFLIPSGPIPPNPAELILLPHVETLFSQLKERFDYVVIDTSPVGLVTDAQLLSRFTDAVLYLVRQNYTFKQQVKLADDLHKNGKMPAMSVVVNDIKFNGGGYGYKYGYGNGYYAEDDEGGKGKYNLSKRLKKFHRNNKTS